MAAGTNLFRPLFYWHKYYRNEIKFCADFFVR